MTDVIKIDFRLKWLAVKAKAILRKRISDNNFNDMLVMQLSDHYSRKAPSKLKKSRVIVRNISPKATSSDLKQYMLKFGKIIEIMMPKEGQTKHPTFAFVQFCTISQAEAAVENANLEIFCGNFCFS